MGAIEAKDVWMKRLKTAIEADKNWCAESGVTLQKALPSKCTGAVDPVMWHIRQNICAGNQATAKYVIDTMKEITQEPEQKNELQLDESSLTARVVGFLKSFRD